LADLQEELVDRFGELPPQARALLDSHRLRLLCKPLGISKLDAGAEQIVVQFAADPPIDPMRIIHLIQKDRNYRLAGQDKLILKRHCATLADRVAAVKDIIHQLGTSGKTMTNLDIDNINVSAFDPMPSPEEIHARLPLSASAARLVMHGREVLRNILDRSDPRLFVVVGPCSIHDPVAGLDYAQRLKALADEVSETLYLVMRVYFEKPRTTTGWKGYINDPDMDDSFHVDQGMLKARAFLLKLAELGLPAGTEALDPIAPQYLGDLISWTAIGARTTESQTHREISSGLSTPVGFKNGTNGDIGIAVNAILSAARPHSFLGINGQGRTSIVRTRGNRYGHLVLRGGDGRPNYDTVSVQIAEQALRKAGLPINIVVDCSHANSYKKHEWQPLVMADVVNQVRLGNQSLVGMMIESNLVAGNQAIPEDLSQLRYGCSVTDACVDWETTEKMIRGAAGLLREVLPAERADHESMETSECRGVGRARLLPDRAAAETTWSIPAQRSFSKASAAFLTETKKSCRPISSESPTLASSSRNGRGASAILTSTPSSASSRCNSAKRCAAVTSMS
jgi:3-deoxy-7-phosphoheptulonate synthase